MKLKVTVEGKVYEVEVEVAEAQAPVGAHAVAPRPALATSAKPSAPAAGGGSAAAPDVADEKALKSPLMGVVQTIEVAAGDSVEADQPLVVLEAMKMLTTITAPAAAKIKNLFISVGDSVKQGQILLEFE